MKRKIKIYPRDFQAEHIASEFPTYADWCRFRDFYGGDSRVNSRRYHRAKNKLNKKSAI